MMHDAKANPSPVTSSPPHVPLSMTCSCWRCRTPLPAPSGRSRNAPTAGSPSFPKLTQEIVSRGWFWGQGFLGRSRDLDESFCSTRGLGCGNER